MVERERKDLCPVCGGTGQFSYFKGVSRFLLSSEECEECAGTGYVLKVADDKIKNGSQKKLKKK